MRHFIHTAAMAAFVAAGLAAIPAAASADPQPHMYAALHCLQNALNNIAIADSHQDHGGYAGAATDEIERAIQDVQQGIDYRNEHGP